MVNLVAGYLRATFKLPSNCRPARIHLQHGPGDEKSLGLTLTVVGCVL